MLKEELIYAESKDSGATFVKNFANLSVTLLPYNRVCQASLPQKNIRSCFREFVDFCAYIELFSKYFDRLTRSIQRHSFEFSVLPINSNANRSNQNGYSTGAI